MSAEAVGTLSFEGEPEPEREAVWASILKALSAGSRRRSRTELRLSEAEHG